MAASTLVVAAALAGVAGIGADRGDAALPHRALKSAHMRAQAKLKRPRLVHGVLTIEGTDTGDEIALRLRAGDPGVLEVDAGADGSADFRFPRARVARIVVDAGAGDDLVRIEDDNGAFTDSIPTTIDGEDGNDAIVGGKGAETLLGGDGNDSIDGNGGNDRALLGTGDDAFVWDPGDGSDSVEGEGGTDTMVFNGADVAERVALSANGSHLRFIRDPGAVTMDTIGVERVDFSALGGADIVTVDDLLGTDVSAVDLDLGRDDRQVDQVTIEGTNGNDTLDVSAFASGLKVVGGRALVAVLDQEPSDRLVVDGLDGDDAIDASTLPADTISLTLDGGAGNDKLGGGIGIETLLGGDGSDSLDGNGGTWALATTPSSGTRATAATPSKVTTARTRCSSTAQMPQSRLTSRRTEIASDSSATPAWSRWTPEVSSVWTSMRSVAPTSSPSTICPGPTSGAWTSTSATATSRPTASSSTAPTATTGSSSAGTRARAACR
jgi:hypothetical protein